MPSEMNQLRKENCSFSKLDGDVKNNHEGGDFKLENEIKRIKSITPKGKKTEDTWKKTIRCAKKVAKVIKHGKKMLHLSRKDVSRKASIEHAIIKYRACIRHRQFLSHDTGTIVSTKGEVLNGALVNLKTCLRDKRKLYWMKVQEGTPLQSIRYPNIEIIRTPGENIDDGEIPCHGYDDLSSQSESDDEGSDEDCYR